jgi:uncharacterized integral membrane protein (TIGR00698 family)
MQSLGHRQEDAELFQGHAQSIDNSDRKHKNYALECLNGWAQLATMAFETALPQAIVPPRLALAGLIPGVLLCAILAAGALLLQSLETNLFGRAWLEALVIAILLGTAVRTAWTPGSRWAAGIAFSGKVLLEVAVALLGATISGAAIARSGPALIGAIAGIVVAAIAVSFALGRLMGLTPRMAALVACGNAICGNSAIAAVAPVISADPEDVAASIAFTAVLGVVVVLTLPLIAIGLGMTPRGFGVLAGLTVYAVPQVLAATAPISSLSAQVGTLVKLIRVLMLGPVVFVLSLIAGRTESGAERRGPGLDRLVPWFIVGFLAAMAARTAGVVPQAAVAPIGQAASWLTIVSMAALGLGVDVRVLAKAGARVTLVVTLSLIALGGMALAAVQLLHLS